MLNPYEITTQMPTSKQARSPMIAWLYLIGGVAIVPFAVIIAALFSGFGHGSDTVGRAIFPYVTLLPNPYAETGWLNTCAIIFQFPIYGCFAAIGPRYSLAVIIGCHALLVAVILNL